MLGLKDTAKILYVRKRVLQGGSMSINDISNIFSFLGGLGMFLYGMHIMSDGMQKSAGDKMSSLLGMLTNNRFLAVGLGALITAIIQSSSATTVMVVGFVSAGLMNLSQAVGVIMGANIGTTVTAWLVSISQLGTAFKVMKPGFYAPLFLGIGAMILLFTKKQKLKTTGEILIGLGLLFIGLDFMSDSLKSYTEMPIFATSFQILGGNPVFGMLIGAIVTAIIQSSSASVGILQTLALSGVVTTSAAIYITLGQNIGSCATAMISSIGASRTAKRAAVIHLTFNVLGAVVFGGLGFIYFTMNKSFAMSNITAVEISIFHTVFNVLNTAILFPFANQLVKFSEKMIKEEDESEDGAVDESAVTLKHLDERIFESPAFAVEAATREVLHMGEITMANVKRGLAALSSGDQKEIEEVYQVEKSINSMEKIIMDYLIKLDTLSLTENQNKVVNNLFYSINDIERIGDHAENLAELAEYITKNNLKFTDVGAADLEVISENVTQALYYALDARKTGSMDSVRKVSQYEDEVDNLEEDMRAKHIERLAQRKCEPSVGVVFLDIISNLERISDHAHNIAGYVKDEM